jgi:hypothetical protein
MEAFLSIHSPLTRATYPGLGHSISDEEASDVAAFVRLGPAASSGAALTGAMSVRDARGDGVENGLRGVTGWGVRDDLVPALSERDRPPR